MFLPATHDEIEQLGWDGLDVILVTGDAYIDSPLVGVALIGKLLLDAGFRVGIIAQPASTEDITRLVYVVPSLPRSLDPADEMDDATFAVTTQIFDTLLQYEPETAVLTAGLALEWSANEGFDVWEFTLRPGVRFQDGSLFNADAVLLSFERLWDRDHPLHVGRIGTFRYFPILFGGFRPPD